MSSKLMKMSPKLMKMSPKDVLAPMAHLCGSRLFEKNLFEEICAKREIFGPFVPLNLELHVDSWVNDLGQFYKQIAYSCDCYGPKK